MRGLKRGWKSGPWMSILLGVSLLLASLLFQPQAMAGPAGSEGLSGPEITTSASAEALWVDAVHGDDDNDGRTPATALRTLQRAANLAQPGTTVHILPGIYRESVRPAHSGTITAPIRYV
ncbi:MAG: hypothetical protein D6759_14085, partial [Chloroflexi bacterium]